ncbi:MAG: response regulator transcription factor [Anaerolineales bacterium]
MAKILIAEDERDIRDLITFTLRFADHEVIVTSNGAEAVEQALKTLPDLIMLDVRMPKMTGYQAGKHITDEETTTPSPVILLSAKGQESEVQTGMDAGAVAYILKPFAPDKLTGRVSEILAKHTQ